MKDSLYIIKSRGKMQLTVFGCDKDERDSFMHYAKMHGVDLNIINELVSSGNAYLACGSKYISVSHKNLLCETALVALKNNGVEYVSTRSIGTNHIDIAVADKLGITVENTYYLPDGVADYTVMMILMALRDAKDILRRVDDNDFSLPCSRAPDLREMTVGIVGNGRIGQEVIKRLTGFGCQVLVCDSQNTSGVDCLPFDELIRQSDILSFHLPLNAETNYILNKDNMHLVKDSAYVVNTSRGGLIETSALLDALKRGKIRGAALDVVEGEEDIFYRNLYDAKIENEALLELVSMPNVIITPHTAFYTRQALLDTVENTILQCLSYERSEQWIS